jgi:hypothetical protein
MDEHAVGGLALTAVVRHSIAIVEMRMLSRVELDLTTSVHLQFEVAVAVDLLHRSQLTIG